MTGSRVWISSHVYVCGTRDGSVLLDLKRDRYFGLGREDSEALADAVYAWPRPAWSRAKNRADTRVDDRAGDRVDDRGEYSSPGALHAERLCDSLVEEGLLSRQEQARDFGVRGDRINMRAEWVSVGDELEVRGEIHTKDVVRFMGAYTFARYSLKCRPFLSTVQSVHARKVRRAAEDDQGDVTPVAMLIDIFRRLRPLVFAAEGRCLPHALTLVKFLSYYDVYPEWVIGVNTSPWVAHSWVQWGNFLLDTNPEKVCQFTPIMVV
jgi:hypothetical protein